MRQKKTVVYTAFLVLACLLAGPAGTAQALSENAQNDMAQGHGKGNRYIVDWGNIQVMDLNTAVQIALAESPTMEAAEARVKQAEERVAQARAAYWPRLDAGAGASRVWLSENDYQEELAYAGLFDPSATIDKPIDYFETDLTASWLVFNGFARRLSNTVAGYGMDQMTYSREDVKRLLMLSVSTSYLSAQLALENTAITKTDEQFYQDRLKEARIRQRVGTGSLGDVLNLEVRVNAAVSDRIRAERAYEASLYSLAALLGLENAALPDHVTLSPLNPETDDEMSHPNPQELIFFAYDHRPDIIQQEIAVKSSEAQVKLAKANYYPTVSVAGTVSGDRYEDLGFDGDDFGNTVGVYLTYNLFSGGLDRARTKEARQKEIETQKNLEAARLEVAADIRSSIAILRSSQEQLQLLRSNADLIRQNRDLAEEEYKAGEGSLVRLNEAQRDLTAAQNRLALALVSMRQSWYALEAKTGHILVSLEQEI